MYDELIKALRKVDEYDSGYAKMMYDAADAIEGLQKMVEQYKVYLQDAINDLHSAHEKEPKWIPVTERLPKKPEGYPKCEIRRTYYLVCLGSGCIESLAYEFDRNEWQITGSPVVAWMPLPEPYEPPKEEA